MARVAVVVLLLVAQPLVACVCAERSVKRAFKDADAMFTAEVVSLRGKITEGNVEHTVTLRVLQSFKKSVRAGDEIVIASGPLTSCTFSFDPAKPRYLIEAYRDDDGSWTTNLCAYSSPLGTERADRAVRLLRRWAWWWRSF